MLRYPPPLGLAVYLGVALFLPGCCTIDRLPDGEGEGDAISGACVVVVEAIEASAREGPAAAGVTRDHSPAPRRAPSRSAPPSPECLAHNNTFEYSTFYEYSMGCCVPVVISAVSRS